MIASVFVRRLKPGPTFDDFLNEWQADVGFGVPTRVFNGPGLDDPRSIVSIGFVAATPADAREWLAAGSRAEQVRHDRIDTVVESTTLRAMYEVRSEHDFTSTPRQIVLGADGSLLKGLAES